MKFGGSLARYQHRKQLRLSGALTDRQLSRWTVLWRDHGDLYDAGQHNTAPQIAPRWFKSDAVPPNLPTDRRSTPQTGK